jgi:hypothetical protein
MHITQSFQLFQAEYTFGMLNEEDNYHNHVIRSRLTRNLASIFDRVHDEIVEAWAERITGTSDGMQCTHRRRIYFSLVSLEWAKISILPTVQQIICRVTSRIFVGAPLCGQPFFGLFSVTFADTSQA